MYNIVNYYNHDTCTIHGTCTMMIVQHSIIMIIRKCIAHPIAVGDIGRTGPKNFGSTNFQFPGLFKEFSLVFEKTRTFPRFLRNEPKNQGFSGISRPVRTLFIAASSHPQPHVQETDQAVPSLFCQLFFQQLCRCTQHRSSREKSLNQITIKSNTGRGNFLQIHNDHQEDEEKEKNFFRPFLSRT